MKRLAVFFVAGALASACAPEGYVIDGRIDGLEGDISLVDAYDHVIMSSPVTNGRFRFEGTVDRPQLMYVNNGLGREHPIDTPVLLENTRIKLRGNVRDYVIKVSGTRANSNMTEYIRRKKLIPDTDIQATAALVAETFKANTDNLLGAMMIQNLAPHVSSEELVECCEKLPAYLRADRLVAHYENLARAIVRTSAGRSFVDLEFDDGEGNPVSLSSVVPSHEATVLVFWCSWDRLCTELMPAFSKVVKAFEPEGVTMMCVSLDYEEEKWEEASRQAGLFGVNLYDQAGKVQDAMDLYGFESIPRAVVISGDGTIMCRTKSPLELEVALRNCLRQRRGPSA